MLQIVAFLMLLLYIYRYIYINGYLLLPFSINRIWPLAITMRIVTWNVCSVQQETSTSIYTFHKHILILYSELRERRVAFTAPRVNNMCNLIYCKRICTCWFDFDMFFKISARPNCILRTYKNSVCVINSYRQKNTQYYALHTPHKSI